MRSKITLFLALALALGCASQRIHLDAKNPSFVVRSTGIYFGTERVRAVDVPEILEDAGIPKSRTVHILVDGQVTSLGEARFLMAVLAKRGYTRPMLVTERHAEARTKP